MAKYGYNKYGAGFRYGETTAISLYYNSQITAWAYDYGTTQVSWTSIVPNPTDAYPTHWKLVKSYSGSLDNPEDGITVLGGPFSEFVTSYTETADFAQGREVNYSIWVFNGQNWIFCGSDYTTVVTSKDTLMQLSSWMPKAWVNQTSGIGDATGEVNSSDFITTLGVFSFMYDKFRSEANLLANVTNYNCTPVAIVNTKITDFGFTYEPALGDSYHRSLFAAGNIINSYKGTALGISAYTTALTHFSNDVEVGHNLMLDYNDSSFEESQGNWQLTTGNAYFGRSKYIWIPYLNPPSSAEPGAVAPGPVVDRNNLPRTIGLATLTTATDQVVKLSLPGNSSDILTKGIPVKERTRYIFTGWVTRTTSPATANARVAYVYIKWYNRFGNLISTTADPSFTLVQGLWVEMTSGSDSGRNGLVSPKGAAFAGIELAFQTPFDSISTTYYLDFFQFAEASKSFEYQDARKILVSVSGNKVNKIPNSSFEDNIAFWSHSGGEITRDISNTSANRFGNSSLKLVIDDVSVPAAFVSDWFSVSASKVLTVSGYLTGSNARTAKVRVEFSNKASESLQTAVLSDENGEYFPTEANYVESDSITLTTSRQIIHVTGIIPPNTRDTGPTFAKVSFYFEGSQVGDVYWLDSVMAENTLEPSDYFSGYGGVFPENPVENTFYKEEDCVWGDETTLNFVANPSFTDYSLVDWSYSGTLTRITSDGSYTPLFGQYFAKLVGNSYHAATTTTGNPVYSYIGPPSQMYYCPSGYYEDGTICRRETNPSQTTSRLSYLICYSGVYMGGGCYSVSYPSVPACPHPEDTLVDVGGVTQCFHDNTASATFTAYLPYEATGGEDFVGSIYVTGAAGTYQLENETYIINESNKDTWVRVHAVKTLTAGQTQVSFTLTITDLASELTPVYLDGAQGEYGRIPSGFVGPENGNMISNYLHLVSGYPRYYFGAHVQNPHSTRGNYVHNYELKSLRLKGTLSLVAPAGSTYSPKVFGAVDNYIDIPSSLVPASSFESSLEGWTPILSVVERKVSLGSLFGDKLTHGQAYARVTDADITSPVPFGISSGDIYLNTTKGGYYASVALRPVEAYAYGTYTLSVDFFDANGVLVQVYLDNLTGKKTTAFVDAAGNANTNITDQVRSKSIHISNTDRWSYLAHTFPVETVAGAYKAKLTVMCDKDAWDNYNVGFDIDRVIFRQ